MLDLFTLAVSMGMQEDLKQIRKEQGEAFNTETAPQEETTASQVAEALESGMNSVETAVSSMASAMIPTVDSFDSMMPTGLGAALTIDLTLPTVNPAVATK